MKPVRSVQEIRRRRILLSWIPAGIGVIVIAAVVAITLNVQNHKVGVPVPAPTSDSRFDAPGLRYIERSRITRINIAKLPISAASIGLGPNQTVVIKSETGLDEHLQLEGNRKYAAITAYSFTIVAKDGNVSRIDFAGQNLDGFPALRTELASAAVFGLTTDLAQTATDQVRLHNADGKPFNQTFGPLRELGVPVTVTVAADGAGSYSVNYRMRLTGE